MKSDTNRPKQIRSESDTKIRSMGNPIQTDLNFQRSILSINTFMSFSIKINSDLQLYNYYILITFLIFEIVTITPDILTR